MNVFPNQNLICPRPIVQPVTPPPRERRRLDGLVEGDPIFVQTPSGICDQGVFIRIEDGFIIWTRTFQGNPFLTITSLDGISIIKL